MFTHFTRLLRTIACLLMLGMSFLALPQQSLAAESHAINITRAGTVGITAPEDPFAKIQTKIEELAKGISKLSTPVAILGIIMVLLLLLFSPLLPEMAQQHKGYIMRALLIVSVISLIPEIVKAFSSLGA